MRTQLFLLLAVRNFHKESSASKNARALIPKRSRTGMERARMMQLRLIHLNSHSKAIMRVNAHNRMVSMQEEVA